MLSPRAYLGDGGRSGICRLSRSGSGGDKVRKRRGGGGALLVLGVLAAGFFAAGPLGSLSSSLSASIVSAVMIWLCRGNKAQFHFGLRLLAQQAVNASNPGLLPS